MRDRLTVVVGLLVLAGVLALLFRDRLASLTGPQITSLVYGLMALMLVGGGVFASRGEGFGRNALRNVAVWLAIGLALALAYVAFAPYLPEGAGGLR